MIVEGRDKEEEEEHRQKGFDGAKTFWTDLIWNPNDDIFSDFIGSCQDISSYSARLIYIIDNASRVVVLNCYDRGQWGFDDLDLGCSVLDGFQDLLRSTIRKE